MIYSMEKVPTTLKAWMEKAIDFHKQKAHIITLKKEQGLPLSLFSSNSHSTKDPDTMDVNTVCLKKHSLANQAQCFREGLCFRCCRKGHSANKCQSSQTPGKPKGDYCPQQVRNTETTVTPKSTTAIIAPIIPIDAFIQNLTTKGKSSEDILQTLKICYKDEEEDVAAATTFPDNEDF